MKNRVSMADIIICVIPGYVWLGAILFVVMDIGQKAIVDQLKVIRLEWVLLSIPASYILGHVMSEVTRKLSKKLLGTNASMKEDNAVSTMVKQKSKERQLNLHMYEVLEYQLDDLLRIKGVSDTWTKYLDSANLTRQLYISGLFFAISYLYNMMMFHSPLVFAIVMASFITLLFATRMRYKKLMRLYFREVQVNYLLACDLEVL